MPQQHGKGRPVARPREVQPSELAAPSRRLEPLRSSRHRELGEACAARQPQRPSSAAVGCGRILRPSIATTPPPPPGPLSRFTAYSDYQVRAAGSSTAPRPTRPLAPAAEGPPLPRGPLHCALPAGGTGGPLATAVPRKTVPPAVGSVLASRYGFPRWRTALARRDSAPGRIVADDTPSFADAFGCRFSNAGRRVRWAPEGGNRQIQREQIRLCARSGASRITNRPECRHRLGRHPELAVLRSRTAECRREPRCCRRDDPSMGRVTPGCRSPSRTP